MVVESCAPFSCRIAMVQIWAKAAYLRVAIRRPRMMRKTTKTSTPLRLAMGAMGLGLALVAAPFVTKAVAGMATSTQVEEPRLLPASTTKSEAAGLQKVVFAGGCFWGVQ